MQTQTVKITSFALFGMLFFLFGYVNISEASHTSCHVWYKPWTYYCTPPSTQTQQTTQQQAPTAPTTNTSPTVSDDDESYDPGQTVLQDTTYDYDENAGISTGGTQQNTNSGPGTSQNTNSGPGTSQNTTPPPSGNSSSLVNPLKFNTITGFLLGVIDVILTLAVPVIVFFIIYAGFLFVTAQGDTTKISTARSALTWAVVGGVIVLGAKIIISVIQGTISAF